MAGIYKPKFVRRIRSALFKFTGPMTAGEKFIVLEEDYINKFDEIVIIGDIHGCYDEFKELVNKLHANSPTRNPDKCLKIIVGDLVNKGPKSEKVLEMCRTVYPESILAVRGNHDEVVLEQYRKFKETREKLAPKNKWIESLPQKYIDYLNCLPYSIKIPSLNCIIVHGGLNPSLEEPERTTPTNLMTTMRNIVVIKDPKTGEPSYHCTKNYTEGIAWATFWPGPQHVYFGHDARRRLQNDHEFATGLDTGCVYGDSLTGVYVKGAKKGKLISIKAKKIYQPVTEE